MRPRRGLFRQPGADRSRRRVWKRHAGDRMMTAGASRILLVRHATTDAVGQVLAGRMAGVGLNADGRQQAAALAARLTRVPLAAVLCGPLERARETAAAIAAPHGLEPRVVAALDESDMGEWTGRSFVELAADPRWSYYNERRSAAAVPGGEQPGELQARIVSALRAIGADLPGAVVAAVTHAEVIRAARLYCAGASFDDWHLHDVPPASITTFRVRRRCA